LQDLEIGVRFRTGEKDYSLLHSPHRLVIRERHLEEIKYLGL
jgi:hypothetical protein